jgi:hypothetical protein
VLKLQVLRKGAQRGFMFTEWAAYSSWKAHYRGKLPTQAIARMNIFPRSDLLAPLDQSSFGLAFGFPRVFTISFLRRSVPGFAEMLPDLERH